MQKTGLVILLVILPFLGFTFAKSDTATTQNFHLDTIKVSALKQFTYRVAAPKTIDLIDTKLAVKFDWKKCRMPVQATIKATPHYFSTDSIVLDAKGFNIAKVAFINQQNDTIKLSYTYDSMQLHIHLPHQFSRKDTFELYIDYVAKPNERRTKSGSAITSDKGLYFINPDGKEKNKPREVWTQGETESASCWFPTIDHPNQKCTQTMYINHEKDFTSLSNGKKLFSISNDDSTETDVWQMDKPHSPYLFMMAVGDFAVSNNYWHDSIPVDYYVDPNYQEYAEEIFGKTPQMIECFSQRLKYPFPWCKYSQVVAHDYVSGAMENTSATLHGEFLQRNSRELLDKNNEDVISHELFHQWFGDLVTAESWSNITLNESFATYGEYIWDEWAYGKDAADAQLEDFQQAYFTESRRKTESIVRYYYNDADDLFDRHSYQKGGCVIHMLRNLVGDSAFYESLHQYLLRYQYKNAEVSQLREVFKDVTGVDLSWFFDEWYFKAGHPKLNINYNYDMVKREEKISIDQTQTEPSLSVFKFPLKIDVHVQGNVNSYNVFVDSRHKDFVLNCEARPDWVNVDADKTLLCEKNDNKTLPEFLYQYHHAKNYKDKLEALQYASMLQSENTSAKELMITALRSPNKNIRKFACENISTDDSFSIKMAAPVLAEIVGDDKEAPIRTAALRKLSYSKKAADYYSTFQKATADSSYTVCAEALKALANASTPIALHVCSTFENETNPLIQRAIAKVYADKGTMDNYPYLSQLLKQNKGGAVYFILNDFGNYLYRMPDPIIEKGTLQLNDIAQHDEEWQVRYAAYEAIKHFKSKYNPDIEKDRISVLNDILKEIKSKEKNRQLLDIYDNEK